MTNDSVMSSGLDGVALTGSARVRDGLFDMLTSAIGEHAYNLGHVDVQVALLVIEAAKRADDREDWFPHGKWATIQAMQERTESELRKLFQDYQSHSRLDPPMMETLINAYDDVTKEAP